MGERRRKVNNRECLVNPLCPQRRIFENAMRPELYEKSTASALLIYRLCFYLSRCRINTSFLPLSLRYIEMTAGAPPPHSSRDSVML